VRQLKSSIFLNSKIVWSEYFSKISKRGISSYDKRVVVFLFKFWRINKTAVEDSF